MNRRIDLHGDLVQAELRHLVRERVRHGPADAHNPNDRADTDDNAQHREQGAHLVGAQALESKADIFKQIHSAPPPVPA